MLSSEFDSVEALENARRYFDLIGTAPAEKKHVIAATPRSHKVAGG